LKKNNIKLIKKNKTLISLTPIQLAFQIVFSIKIYIVKKLYLYYSKYYFINLAIQNIVIKPRPAWQIDRVARPVRVCQKTGQCNNPAKLSWPDELTHDLGEPGRDQFLFFKCGFSPIPLFFHIFFSWLLTLFKVYYINIIKIFYFSM